MEYNFKKIEKKWQKYWEDNNSFKAVTGDKTKEPYYILVEFPYPSGAGLHVGHVYLMEWCWVLMVRKCLRVRVT